MTIGPIKSRVSLIARCSVLIVLSTGLSACNRGDKPTSKGLYQRVLKEFGEGERQIKDAAERCVRRQGYNGPMGGQMLATVALPPQVVPAAYLLSWTDEDLQKYQMSTRAIELPKEYYEARYRAVHIDGRLIDGGCEAWARALIRSENQSFVMASAVVKNMERVRSQGEKELVRVRLRWRSCLPSGIRKLLVANNIGPDTVRLSMANETLDLVKSMRPISQIRQTLSARIEDQKLLADSSDRCAKRVRYYDKVDELMGVAVESSIAQADPSWLAKLPSYS